MDKEVATGVNIFTEGEDPKFMPDEQYPPWLWDLADPLKTAKQLHQKAAGGDGYEALTDEEYFRLVKLERKAKIKAHNFANRKK
jgi:hypothetical protein